MKIKPLKIIPTFNSEIKGINVEVKGSTINGMIGSAITN